MIPTMLKDALASVTGLLPSSTQTNASSFLTLGNGYYDTFLPEKGAFQLTIPVLTGTQLPISAVINFLIESCPDTTGNTLTTEIQNLYTLAGSSVAATLVIPFRLAMNVGNNIRVKSIGANALPAAVALSVELAFVN